MLKDPDIKSYILNYAKEYYVERRDNPLNKLPYSVSPRKFYIDELNNYKKELERFKSLTEDESKIEEIAYRKKEIDDYNSYIENERIEIDKLKNAILNIEMWKCQESLLELKDGVIKNLKAELWRKMEHLKYNNPICEREMSGKEFKDTMIERYQDMVRDYSRHVDREYEWVNKTNKLLTDLKDNLGDW